MKKKIDLPEVTFVLLGASNLARGHQALARCLLQNLHPQPIKFLFALGPGRCYRASGGILWYQYSPIETSDVLFRAGEIAKGGGQLIALVTDIGNDIMHGVSVDELISCLENIFQILEKIHAPVFVTPISSLLEEELDLVSFSFLKRIFYPKSRMTYLQTVSSISQVNKFLKNKQRISLITGLEAFAGIDKIHYGFAGSCHAWTRIADALSGKGNKTRKLIRFSTMMASYQRHYRQLIFNDLLSLGSRDSSYF